MDDEHRPNHEGRSRMYKTNGRDQNEMRRKRREDEVQIRKSRREDKFDRNRKIAIQRSLSDEETSELVKTVADGLQSMHEAVFQEALRKLHQNVTEKVWSVHVLVNSQMVSSLTDVYCNRVLSNDSRRLISRILFALTDLEDLQLSADDTCIQSLVGIISTYITDEQVLCDTFQAVANFIIRSITYRNLALDGAIVPELMCLCGNSMSITLNRSLMWLVSLFCEKLERFSPHVDEIAPLLELVAFGVQSSDPMIQTDAATACASLAEWPPIYRDMKSQKLCSMLVANLRNDKGNARPTVKSGISSIIQATGYFTEEMIEAGLLEVLKEFVNVSYLSQEICFIISNICAEGEPAIDKLIQSGLLREVARVMETAEYRARKEAAFVICHCCTSANSSHHAYVAELGILEEFTDLLTCMDVPLVSYILDAIYSLLLFGELHLAPDGSNVVAMKLEEIGCREKLNFLCESQCVDIHAKAYTIIDRFYEDEEAKAIEAIVANDLTSQCNHPANTTIDDTIEMILRNNTEHRNFSF